jgi:hypothetical protein
LEMSGDDLMFEEFTELIDINYESLRLTRVWWWKNQHAK